MYEKKSDSFRLDIARLSGQLQLAQTCRT